jgi:acetyl esterase/lipase
LDDCLDGYHHLLASGIAPQRIVVGGDSAGGNLCLAMLLALRDRGEPLPAGAFALSPVTDLRSVDIAPGHTSADPDAIFQVKDHGARDPRRLYVGGRDELFSDPYVSPLCGELHGLCPLLLQCGSTETLRRDAARFVAKARAAGVDAEAEVWEGQAHVWHAMPLPESRQAFDHLGDFIRRCCP